MNNETKLTTNTTTTIDILQQNELQSVPDMSAQHKSADSQRQSSLAIGTTKVSSQCLQKQDKCVCTQDTLVDLQRTMTYEAVFNSLLEQKMLAMKRDCEERKRLKRAKRKSLGRILLGKKLFGSRKSISGRLEGQSELTDAHNAVLSVQSCTAKKIVGRSRTVDEIEMASPTDSASQQSLSPKSSTQRVHKLRTRAATSTASVTAAAPVSQETPALGEDSIASSTISNSSGRQVARRSVLVRAQTHTPAAETVLTSSSSADSKELKCTGQSSVTNENGNGNGNGNAAITIYDTASLGSTYEGTEAKVHTSTLADDSLTSLRDSIESLSFASSRCTVSFGATEIIPEDTASYLYERVRAAKRLRILEAKSISAQCSPIFPRHMLQKSSVPATQATVTTQTKQLPPKTAMESLLLTTLTNAQANINTNKNILKTESIVRPQRTIMAQTRLLPKQSSYTESMYGCVLDVNGSRNISRQNTSEDSANVTMSTLLNQSDSISLQAPACFSSTSRLAKEPERNSSTFLPISERFKSRSASILVVSHPAPSVGLAAEQLEKLHLGQRQGVENLDNTIIPRYYPTVISSTKAMGTQCTNSYTNANTPLDLATLNRMTSTSTASSVAPTGCCTTIKSNARDKDKDKEKQKERRRFKPTLMAAGHSGSDDEYRKRKRKYKRYHRCSDPVLVYPTPSGLQHCIITMPTTEPSQFPYEESYIYDAQLGMDLDGIDDLEQIVPSSARKHRKHRHHRHKKRRRHKKSKMLEDLQPEVVKPHDPNDLSARARWTIIATACLLLLMCLMLVGITLRMAPIIDDMVRQENERLMKETMERARYGKNFTESASLISSAAQLLTSTTMRQQQQQQHQHQQNQQQAVHHQQQPQQHQQHGQPLQ